VTTSSPDIDSPRAWRRLAAAAAIGAVGSVGMWSYVVVLPAVQAEFGATRAEAALPYTLTMVGFALGGVLMGRVSDRYGALVPVVIGACVLAAGYAATAHASSLWQFALAHGVLIGVGSAAMFGPLMADVSHWFAKHRGKAVTIAASGNYLAGAIWPPFVQHFTSTQGWRATQVAVGLIAFALILPLSLALRRRSPAGGAEAARTNLAPKPMPVPANALMVALSVAGVACCVAMSMPQVHIVAYCGDLGYGPARGAEMLSLMLAFGIVSRVATGFVADRIGGLPTLLIGSTLQGAALFLYLLFDGLTSLYVISILFGLFQGGIVPSYAIIVREYFPPASAATRVGVVLMMTLFGMALGGWLSGLVYDLSGSYRWAFLNGLAWNLVNVAIVAWLLLAAQRRAARAA
jgi:MFS family permease